MFSLGPQPGCDHAAGVLDVQFELLEVAIIQLPLLGSFHDLGQGCVGGYNARKRGFKPGTELMAS
jgi:hypothetical protein